MAAGSTLPVIVNRAAGAASRAGEGLADRIEAAFAAASRPMSLELVAAEGLADALSRHRDEARLVVGGGDGTLGAAAASVARRGAELAILPLGTRNHFARELGIPLDLQAAATLAAEGRSRRVDLAEAAGGVFVNNLSAGAYVDLVRAREASRLPRFVATIAAVWRVLRKLRSRRFDLIIDGARRSLETPQLFVGNNLYEVENGRPGERAALDDGLLSIYAVAPLSRTALLAAALRTFVGRTRMHHDFALDRTAREVRIDGPGASLEVTLDGERRRFDLPLRLRIRPRALAVVAPESG